MDNNNNQNSVSQKISDSSVKSGQIQSSNVIGVGGFSKERNVVPVVKSSEVEARDLTSELEIPKEVQNIGVVQRKENIEVPPDIANLGVRQAGVSVPMAQPSLKLPIDDIKIIQGLQLNILSSLRWLSEWCLFQLKRVHLTLKVIGGRVVRVRYKQEKI